MASDTFEIFYAAYKQKLADDLAELNTERNLKDSECSIYTE
jgi:hypothetical protein